MVPESLRQHLHSDCFVRQTFKNPKMSRTFNKDEQTSHQSWNHQMFGSFAWLKTIKWLWKEKKRFWQGWYFLVHQLMDEWIFWSSSSSESDVVTAAVVRLFLLHHVIIKRSDWSSLTASTGASETSDYPQPPSLFTHLHDSSLQKHYFRFSVTFFEPVALTGLIKLI